MSPQEADSFNVFVCRSMIKPGRRPAHTLKATSGDQHPRSPPPSCEQVFKRRQDSKTLAKAQIIALKGGTCSSHCSLSACLFWLGALPPCR